MMLAEAQMLSAEWGIPIAIALIAVGVRLLFSSSRITFPGIIRSIVVAVFVGLLAAKYIFDTQSYTDGVKYIVIALMAILSEDLVEGILRLGRKFNNDPEGFIKSFVRFIKGDRE